MGTLKAFWSKIFQVLKDYGCQPKLLQPGKLFATVEVEKKKKPSLDPNSLKNFISNPIIKTLSRILEAILLTEESLNTAKRL